jgi:hypothetical protein
VWENTAQVADGSWIEQEIDISAVADYQPTVYLRWTMGTTDGSWQFCGWNIDDVQLLALGGAPQCETDPDCDDGSVCTTETCSGGLCVYDPIVCDDGDLCTVDSCDPVTGCYYPPLDCAPLVCYMGTCVPPDCNGNGDCEVGEDCVVCPADCYTGPSTGCGNGACEPIFGEDCLSCPADCNGKQVGGPSNRYCCGDGDGVNPVGCTDPRCTGAGNTCTDGEHPSSCCGDAICEGGENVDNCPIDCDFVCGDGTCDAGEDSCNCPDDCGLPPGTETSCTDGFDNDCDGFVDCDDVDCGTDPACASSCAPRGELCATDGECCSNRCHRGVCK